MPLPQESGVMNNWTFSRFGEHGDVMKPGHCKWCGRTLRKKWRLETPPHTLDWIEGDQHMRGHAIYPHGILRGVKVGEPKIGDYGDGYFCGLRCGRDFGLWHAEHGNFLRPAVKS